MMAVMFYFQLLMSEGCTSIKSLLLYGRKCQLLFKITSPQLVLKRRRRTLVSGTEYYDNMNNGILK